MLSKNITGSFKSIWGILTFNQTTLRLLRSFFILSKDHGFQSQEEVLEGSKSNE